MDKIFCYFKNTIHKIKDFFFTYEILYYPLYFMNSIRDIWTKNTWFHVEDNDEMLCHKLVVPIMPSIWYNRLFVEVKLFKNDEKSYRISIDTIDDYNMFCFADNLDTAIMKYNSVKSFISYQELRELGFEDW